jgi:hypothetical protein
MVCFNNPYENIDILLDDFDNPCFTCPGRICDGDCTKKSDKEEQV